MEICNSFELLVSLVDGHAVLDKEYFTAKEEQCMQFALTVCVVNISYKVINVCNIASFILTINAHLQSSKCSPQWSFLVGTQSEIYLVLRMSIFMSRHVCASCFSLHINIPVNTLICRSVLIMRIAFSSN